MTDMEKAPAYPLSELPSFIFQNKSDMTVEELDYQCQKLREENHQLQLRILGVNELARLLQDRNELVTVLKERNKRLEVSVVRLENRCANFERQIKSQKNSSIPSAKPGQSPFIPGPSRQILETLMQENSELKKTVNSLQKKGSTGYLEAVKTTQLEEFIEQQKKEIDTLRNQIMELTSSGEEESALEGGGMSLPASVTDTGPLKRQLIKMQQMAAVKDRFCSLLSQQVSELQKKLNSMQSEIDGGKEVTKSGSGDSEISSSSGRPISETEDPGPVGMDATPYVTKEEISHLKKMLQEKQSTLEQERKEKAEYLDKINQLEGNAKKISLEKEKLQDKVEELTHLYATVLSDRDELSSQIESLKSELDRARDGNSGGNDVVERLQKELLELQKTMDKQVEDYSRELRSKDIDLSSIRIELEESNLKYMMADSQATQLQNKLKQKESEMSDVTSRMHEVQDDKEVAENEIRELKVKLFEMNNTISQLKYSRVNPTSSFPLTFRTGGAPSLIGNTSGLNIDAVADTPNAGVSTNFNPSTAAKQTLMSRNVPDKPQAPSNVPPQQKPVALNLHQQPQLPPNSSHRSNSPMPSYPRSGGQRGEKPLPHSSSQNPPTPMGTVPTTPSRHTCPVNQSFGPPNTSMPMNRVPTASMGPMTSHYHPSPSMTQPISSAPRSTSNIGGVHGPPPYGGRGVDMSGSRYMSSTGYHPVPMVSPSVAPRGGMPIGTYHPMSGAQQPVFGPTPVPPSRSQSQYSRPDGSYKPYPSDGRDRSTGSTSPNPTHENTPSHPSQFGGGSSGHPPHPYH